MTAHVSKDAPGSYRVLLKMSDGTWHRYKNVQSSSLRAMRLALYFANEQGVSTYTLTHEFEECSAPDIRMLESA